MTKRDDIKETYTVLSDRLLFAAGRGVYKLQACRIFGDVVCLQVIIQKGKKKDLWLLLCQGNSISQFVIVHVFHSKCFSSLPEDIFERFFSRRFCSYLMEQESDIMYNVILPEMGLENYVFNVQSIIVHCAQMKIVTNKMIFISDILSNCASL